MGTENNNTLVIASILLLYGDISGLLITKTANRKVGTWLPEEKKNGVKGEQKQSKSKKVNMVN